MSHSAKEVCGALERHAGAEPNTPFQSGKPPMPNTSGWNSESALSPLHPRQREALEAVEGNGLKGRARSTCSPSSTAKSSNCCSKDKDLPLLSGRHGGLLSR